MIHTTKHDLGKHDLGLTIVSPGVERLVAANAKDFKEDMVALIETGATTILVNFENVTFIDSSGLGALVGVLKKIGFHGDLSICGLKPDVMQMFKICRMDRVFTILPDQDKALQKLEGRL